MAVSSVGHKSNMGGGVGVARDEDENELTPRPLQVFKRIYPGTSKNIHGINPNRDPAPSLARSISQRTLVPCRRSSVLNNTQLCLPRQASARSASSLSCSDAPLNVRKQRHNDRLSTSMPAPGMAATPSTEPMINSNPAQPTPGPKSAPVINRYTWQTWPTASRSQSSSVIHSKEFLRPTKQSLSASSDPAPETEPRRRAATAGELAPIGGGCDPTNSQILQRVSSSRPRLISRIMSGFSGRSQLHSAKVVDEDESKIQPPYEKADDCAKSHGAKRCSQSSTHTEPCSKGELNETLAAFPTPSRTASTPPTSTKGSSESSRPRGSEHPELCKPQSVTPLTAELSLTTEFDHISFENEESMFVAVDVKATVPATTRVRDEGSPIAALDAVIIIDNS